MIQALIISSPTFIMLSDVKILLHYILLLDWLKNKAIHAKFEDI